MLKEGLADEVKGLLEEGYSPNLVSMQGLGYKEFVPYFSRRMYVGRGCIYIEKRHTPLCQTTADMVPAASGMWCGSIKVNTKMKKQFLNIL